MKRALMFTTTILFLIGILSGPAFAAEKVLRFPHTQTTRNFEASSPSGSLWIVLLSAGPYMTKAGRSFS